MQNILYDRKTKLFTFQYENENILFDNFDNLYWIYDAISTDKINWKIDWKIDETNKLLYCVDAKNNKIYLIEKILNILIKDKKIIFIDGNNLNYCVSNFIIINLNEVKVKTNKNKKLPKNFPIRHTVFEYFKGHKKIFSGNKLGKIFNPYWLGFENDHIEREAFFIMSCNDNQYYFKFSKKSFNYIKDKTWFLSENGYIVTIEKNNYNKKYHCYLHQLICKTEKGDYSSTKSIYHINGNKLDNRIENLVWVRVKQSKKSKQNINANANTDKIARNNNYK